MIDPAVALKPASSSWTGRNLNESGNRSNLDHKEISFSGVQLSSRSNRSGTAGAMALTAEPNHFLSAPTASNWAIATCSRASDVTAAVNRAPLGCDEKSARPAIHGSNCQQRPLTKTSVRPSFDGTGTATNSMPRERTCCNRWCSPLIRSASASAAQPRRQCGPASVSTRSTIAPLNPGPSGGKQNPRDRNGAG